jgi:polysaccharide export outer membrane protein
MRWPLRPALRALPLALAVLAGPGAAQEAYRLNAGDVLRVSVWREDGLDRELLVQPDGNVSFPLAGQLEARGRTTVELEKAIGERLERFIPGPVVTVELVEARGNVVYVIGEVNSPGAFQLGRPTSVMQVLSQAGGFTAFAGKSRVRIVRRAAGAETTLGFNFNEVAEGRAPASNIDLQPGDVIVVPGGSLF